MAQWALVKIDDFNSTKSNGGIVEWVTPKNDLTINQVFPKESLSNYRKFEVNDDVKIGWIYKDKTQEFVDSNISSN